MKNSKDYFNRIKKFLVGEVQNKKLEINEKRFSYYIGFSAHVPATRFFVYSAKDMENGEGTYVTTDHELEEGSRLSGNVRVGGIMLKWVSNYLVNHKPLENEK